MGAIFNVFPLIGVPLFMYNFFALLAGSGAAARNLFKTEIMAFPMPSTETIEGVITRVNLSISLGDLFIFFSMGLMFIELLKSTSTGTAAIFNHALAFIVLLVGLLQFFVFSGYATAAFFVIVITAVLDVLAGVVVTIISARRDVEFAGQH